MGFGNISAWQFLIVLVIVLFIFGTRYRGKFLRVFGDEIKNVNDELKEASPVFSAETTENKEAEVIRDRLPTRFPVWLLPIAAVIVSVAIWWFSR